MSEKDTGKDAGGRSNLTDEHQIHDAGRAREVAAGIRSGGGGNAIPSEAELIRFGFRRIKDSKTDPRLKLRYWERMGEWLHLWGPKADSRKPQQPVDFNIEDDPANLP